MLAAAGWLREQVSRLCTGSREQRQLGRLCALVHDVGHLHSSVADFFGMLAAAGWLCEQISRPCTGSREQRQLSCPVLESELLRPVASTADVAPAAASGNLLPCVAAHLKALHTT